MSTTMQEMTRERFDAVMAEANHYFCAGAFAVVFEPGSWPRPMWLPHSKLTSTIGALVVMRDRICEYAGVLHGPCASWKLHFSTYAEGVWSLRYDYEMAQEFTVAWHQQLDDVKRQQRLCAEQEKDRELYRDWPTGGTFDEYALAVFGERRSDMAQSEVPAGRVLGKSWIGMPQSAEVSFVRAAFVRPGQRRRWRNTVPEVELRGREFTVLAILEDDQAAIRDDDRKLYWPGLATLGAATEYVDGPTSPATKRELCEALARYRMLTVPDGWTRQAWEYAVIGCVEAWPEDLYELECAICKRAREEPLVMGRTGSLRPSGGWR